MNTKVHPLLIWIPFLIPAAYGIWYLCFGISPIAYRIAHLVVGAVIYLAIFAAFCGSIGIVFWIVDRWSKYRKR